jgi:hypothetical protein
MGETKGDEENPDAVNEYLRRFNKRKQTQQEKTSTNYGLNILLGVLFSFTLAVLILGAYPTNPIFAQVICLLVIKSYIK